jgi:hypothetical protein
MTNLAKDAMKTMSIHEIYLAAEISKIVIDKIIKDTGLPSREHYSGEMLPYLLEYVNNFAPDAIEAIKEEHLDDLHHELASELLWLECFVYWLDNEKGMKLVKK